MNRPWWNGILTALMISLTSVGAFAANNNVQVLGDKELAKVTGGFCPFYTCETGAPSGNCQPFPPNQAGLCLARTCTLVTEQLGNTQVVGCVLAGKVTCTKNGAYRQCVAGKLWSVCWNSGQNKCGTLVIPHCTYDMVAEHCDCTIIDDRETPCDWDNCLLEAQ